MLPRRIGAGSVPPVTSREKRAVAAIANAQHERPPSAEVAFDVAHFTGTRLPTDLTSCGRQMEVRHQWPLSTP
ncbi:hypothetical protein CUR178_05479 [Leishmania enriettii]|uniref:Uncharacterized protein n=1 Tax=Leishmania enriettii TaxID=5663 RepID=A0A836KUR5_LEIEN|nr:hypothetical protein CUR178_05479 [Leishmania enriettii]